jgi:hypothetical protein
MAYQKAINFIRDKSTNIWTIVIKYMSKGAHFKLEDRIKSELQTEHVIYNPLQKQTHVLLDRDDDILELNTKINNYQKELKIYLQKEIRFTPCLRHYSRLPMWTKTQRKTAP